MDLIAKRNRHIMDTKFFGKPVSVREPVSPFFGFIDVMAYTSRMIFKRFDADVGADKSEFGFGVDGANSFECRGSHECVSEPVGKNDEYFHDVAL